MVSNEEIKRMLDAKRRGVDVENEKTKSLNYKVCPDCKTKNPEKSRFCVNCGKKLDTDLKMEPKKIGIPHPESDFKQPSHDQEVIKSSDKPIEKSEETESVKKPSQHRVPSTVPEHTIINKPGLKKTCPSCSGKNLKNAKFCVVCGQKFDEKTLGETEEVSETVPTKIKVPDNEVELKNKVKTEEKLDEKNVESTHQDAIKEPETKNVDPVEKIKKAKELLDIGAITSEEFEHIKKKYLDQI